MLRFYLYCFTSMDFFGFDESYPYFNWYIQFKEFLLGILTDNYIEYNTFLRCHAIHESRERNCFTNVFHQTAYPGDFSLNAETETCMRNRSIFSQIEIPLKRFLIESVGFYLFSKRIIIILPLPSANDLTVPFGYEHVTIKYSFRTVQIFFHIERLYTKPDICE